MIRNLEKIIQYFVYIFLFALPWQTIWIVQERFVNGSKWEYGTVGFFATEILAWVCVLLFMGWYVGKIQNSQFTIQKFFWSKDRIFLLSICFFILYSLFLIPFAGEPSLAFQHGRRLLLGFLLFLLFFIGPIKKTHALTAFVLGSVPVSILGMWQFLTQSTVASTLFGLSQYIVSDPGTSIITSESIGRWLRSYGSFSHPNVFGGYLVFAIASTLLVFRTSLRWRYRFLLETVLILQTAALFFTFSRSAWVSVFIVVLLHCYIVFRGVKGPSPFLRGREIYKQFLPVSTIVLTFAVLAIIFSQVVQTRFAGAAPNEVASITERVSGYEQALQLFKGNAWFGVGGGNYTHALIETFPDAPGWWYQPVHNVPLLFAVEYGVVGVVLLLVVLVSFIGIQNSEFRFQNVFYLLMIAPLLLLDHYLWSSYVGLGMLFVYTSVYFRFFGETSSPHIVPKQSTL